MYHNLNLANLVAGAKAIKHMQKRHARLQGAGLRDQREVHHLLHRVGEQHGPACAAGRHHIAVVAKDGQAMRGKRVSGNRPLAKVSNGV
jgi:hypothetical protein